MKFSPGDRVRVDPDHVYTSPDDLLNVEYTIETTFYTDLFECFHVTLKGIKGSWFEGRFELVNHEDSFTLDWFSDENSSTEIPAWEQEFYQKA